LYAKVYDDILKRIETVKKELDIDEPSPLKNPDFMTSLKKWGREKKLEASYFEDVLNWHESWKKIADNAKERIPIEVKKDEVFGLKKSIFYGNWKNMVFGKLIKGNADSNDQIVYSMAQLHGREEIRYNFNLASVLEEDGNEMLKDRYFVCIGIKVKRSRFAQDPYKSYPLDISADSSSVLVDDWVEEIPEPLRSQVKGIKKDPKYYIEQRYEFFDESLHEDLAIHIIARGKSNHFYKQPGEVRSMLARTGFFEEKYLETIKVKEYDDDIAYVKFRQDCLDCQGCQHGREKFEKAKGKNVMIDGKLCSTDPWSRGRNKSIVRIDANYKYDSDCKKFIEEKFKEYENQLLQTKLTSDKKYIIIQMKSDTEALIVVREVKGTKLEGLVTYDYYQNSTHRNYKVVYQASKNQNDNSQLNNGNHRAHEREEEEKKENSTPQTENPVSNGFTNGYHSRWNNEGVNRGGMISNTQPSQRNEQQRSQQNYSTPIKRSNIPSKK